MGRGWRHRGPGSAALLCWVLVMESCVPGSARAAGLRDFGDGWLIGPRQAALVLGPAASEIRATGTGGGMPSDRNRWGVWVSAGQGRLFSMPELPLTSVSGGIRHRGGSLPWVLGWGWERLGGELMVEDTGAVHLRLGANPQLGVRVRARRWMVAGRKVYGKVTPALEVRFSGSLASGVEGQVGFWLHPGDLPVWYGRGGRRTLVEAWISGRGGGAAVRVDQRGDGRPILSLEFMGRLSPVLGLGGRADPETGTLGGNLTVRAGRFWFRTSHLVHPALGVTHRFQLGAGDPGAAIR